MPRRLTGYCLIGVISAMAFAAAPCFARTASAPTTSAAPANYAELATLFAQWRRFVPPRIINGSPDYGKVAMARQAAALPAWQRRLQAIDLSGWSQVARTD